MVLLPGLLAGCAALLPLLPDAARDAADVRAAETAFARTMADRDFEAFGAWIADDAVFINSGKPLRGKAAILAHWKRFFEPREAPFAWEPEIVEVSRDVGYTEGPVNAGGNVFARFYTTWQRGADGRWRVVFDNGYTVCKCPK